MKRYLSVTLLLLLACSDEPAERPADASPAAPDAAPEEADAAPEALAGAYARVVPGYDTEAACRAENPDALFSCRELLSLCEGGRAFILFTDIVFDGDWTRDGDGATLTFETWDGAFSTDGTTAFERQEDGSLLSDEVYGARPFAPSADPVDSLCP